MAIIENLEEFFVMQWGESHVEKHMVEISKGIFSPHTNIQQTHKKGFLHLSQFIILESYQQSGVYHKTINPNEAKKEQKTIANGTLREWERESTKKYFCNIYNSIRIKCDNAWLLEAA